MLENKRYINLNNLLPDLLRNQSITNQYVTPFDLILYSIIHTCCISSIFNDMKRKTLSKQLYFTWTEMYISCLRP
jgi:hypothetical protein